MTLKTFKTKTSTPKPLTKEQLTDLIDKGSIDTSSNKPTEETILPTEKQPAPKPFSQHKKKTPIRMMFELSKQEPTEDQIEQLAQELYEWPNNDEALTLRRFHLLKGVRSETFMRWVRKYPILKYSYDMARMAIGLKLEKLAMIKDSGANASFIMRILHQYSEEWKEADEYHDGRKIKIEKAKVNMSNDKHPKDRNWL